MGKRFYATSRNRKHAKAAANHYAKHYEHGVCYTPAKDSDCVKIDDEWRCMARAHHHRGSCGSREFDSAKSLPVHFDSGLIEEYTDATDDDFTGIEDLQAE